MHAATYKRTMISLWNVLLAVCMSDAVVAGVCARRRRPTKGRENAS